MKLSHVLEISRKQFWTTLLDRLLMVERFKKVGFGSIVDFQIECTF